MARAERTAEDIRGFAKKVSDIAETLERSAELMDENGMQSIAIHADDILRRILPSLFDWSIGIEADVRRAVARIGLELDSSEEKPARKKRKKP